MALSSNKTPLTNNNKSDNMQQPENNQIPSAPPSQSPVTINNAENKTTGAADDKGNQTKAGKTTKPPLSS